AALTQRFEHQSLHDPLTGLANRSLFGSQMEQAWSHHKRHGRGLVVIVLDLDDFKTINDRHGHHVGDQVLIEVARRTQTCVRDSDTVARLGGDEFAIILPEADLADAQAVADRVRRELARPIAIAGEPHRAAASIGIARATEDQQTAGDLLREADAAMYVDKAANRERD
ncbi:MAG TPA: GGDEF domain-containing protein, partial [Euzebya sp.]|nr:GGDEF domain-containing protein [Euzebya sp.]